MERDRGPIKMTLSLRMYGEGLNKTLYMYGTSKISLALFNSMNLIHFKVSRSVQIRCVKKALL